MTQRVNGSKTKARPTYRAAEERPDAAPAPLPGGRWRVAFEAEGLKGIRLEVRVELTANGAHDAWRKASPVLGGLAFSAVKVSEIGGRA